MLPTVVEDLILDYARSMNKHAKMENLYYIFLKDFERIYRCVHDKTLNEMGVCPLSNPQWNLISPGPYVRFERGQMRMNAFAYKVMRAEGDVQYWLKRAFADIPWGGTEILFWNSAPSMYFTYFRPIMFNHEWYPDLSSYETDHNDLRRQIVESLQRQFD